MGSHDCENTYNNQQKYRPEKDHSFGDWVST